MGTRGRRLPDVRIHDLWHSAASFMVNSRVEFFAERWLGEFAQRG